MALALGHALTQFVGLRDQVDEEDSTISAGQEIPVGALERGAGDDRLDALGGARAHPIAHGFQPRPPVLVGQGDAPAHLGDVGGGVELVGLGDGPAEGPVKVVGGGGLAAAGHAHEDEVLNRAVHALSLMTSLSVTSAIILTDL